MTADKEKIVELLESQANILVATGTGRGSSMILKSNIGRLTAFFGNLYRLSVLKCLFRGDLYGNGTASINRISGPMQIVGEVGSCQNEALDKLEELAKGAAISSNNLGATARVVSAALSDADILLMQGRPLSAVYRVHTALHGLLP